MHLPVHNPPPGTLLPGGGAHSGEGGERSRRGWCEVPSPLSVDGSVVVPTAVVAEMRPVLARWIYVGVSIEIDPRLDQELPVMGEHEPLNGRQLEQ